MTAERKRLRAQLQVGELTLEQALAQDGEAARRMRVVTVVRALLGIGAATAARLMREAGIDPGQRAGALTAGQRIQEPYRPGLPAHRPGRRAGPGVLRPPIASRCWPAATGP